MTATPALRHLLGAYLNQDWFDFFDTEDEAICTFLAESPEFAAALPAEIDDALERYPAEADLEAYLDSIGCEYLPSADVGYRGWLRTIAASVRTTIAG